MAIIQSPSLPFSNVCMVCVPICTCFACVCVNACGYAYLCVRVWMPNGGVGNHLLHSGRVSQSNLELADRRFLLISYPCLHLLTILASKLAWFAYLWLEL